MKQRIGWVMAVALAGCGHTESSLREEATEIHDNARRVREPSAFHDAQDAIERYLSEYGGAEFAPQMRLRYADVLVQLGAHAKAGPVYDKIAAEDGGLPPDLKREAAAKAIRAWEHVVPDEAVYRTDSAKKKLRIDPKGNYDKKTIPADELALANASDRYVAISDPDRDKLSGIKFSAGYIYFRNNHFADAADRFGEVVERWPDTDLARISAKLIIDSLKVQKDYPALEKHGRALIKNEKLTRGNRKFIAQLQAMIESSALRSVLAMDETARAELDVLKRNIARASVADKLIKLRNEFAKSQFADEMLFNAALIYWNSERYDDAAKTYRLLIEEYEKSPLFARSKAALRKVIGQADQCFSATDAPKAHPSDSYIKNCEDLELEQDWAEANNCWEGFAATHRGAPLFRRLEARVRRAEALLKIGEQLVAFTELEQVLARFKDRDLTAEGQPRMKNTAARAAFILLERDMDAYRRLTVSDDPKTLIVKMIKAKELAAPKGKGKYGKIRKLYGDACFATAADARAAEVWLDIADRVRKAPPPRGLSPAQITTYKAEQDKQAQELESHAAKALEAAVKTASESRLTNRWTALARELAARLGAR